MIPGPRVASCSACSSASRLEASPAHAAEAGSLLLLHHTLGNSAAPAFDAAAMRDGVPRLDIVALKLLMRALDAEDVTEFANVLDQPLDPPSHEALRQAALLTAGPADAPPDPLVALEAEVGFPLLLTLVTTAAGTGWSPPVDLLVRYATLGEQAGFDVAPALYTWAARAARRSDDPRANDFARRGGWEARIAAHLREDDPEAAIQVARGLVDRLTSPIGQVVCRGLLGVILAALGRDDQAHAVLAPVIDTQRPFGFFVHLARALLGLPATFAALADRKDIEAWRAGRPLLKEGPVTDQRFVFAWALSRRPHSG